MEPNEKTKMNENKRPFAVTGVEHGMFIYTDSKNRALDHFNMCFPGEQILNIRDWKNEPFEVKGDYED